MQLSFQRIHESATVPQYQTAGSAAADIAACLDDAMVIEPHAIVLVPTGLALEIPDGYEAQIRARSGLSLRHGISLANGIGTIDADYRGELGVILINNSNKPFTVEHGMRIAQLAVVKVEQASWAEVDELGSTERGEGGYGSTGH